MAAALLCPALALTDQELDLGMSVRCKLSMGYPFSYLCECPLGAGRRPGSPLACAEASPATSSTRRHVAVYALAFPAGPGYGQMLSLD